MEYVAIRSDTSNFDGDYYGLLWSVTNMFNK